jgi:DNA-binding MarR family transcriptional regulator
VQNDIHAAVEDIQREAKEADRSSICMKLRKAARATSQILDVLLAPLGIRASQMSVLNQISVLGAPSMTELADAAMSDRTTLTRNLGPLARDGYVEIVPGSDKRIHLVKLTDQGEELLAKALLLRKKSEDYIIEEVE